MLRYPSPIFHSWWGLYLRVACRERRSIGLWTSRSFHNWSQNFYSRMPFLSPTSSISLGFGPAPEIAWIDSSTGCVQQFTIGMLNSIEEEITLKMNLVLLDQGVQSLQKTLKLSVSWSVLIHILHINRYKTLCRLDRQQLNLFDMII